MGDKTYPITLSGFGNNPNYSIDNDENFVYIKPSPPYPNKNLPNNGVATGQYDSNTNILYITVQYPNPNSVVKQTLQNCTSVNGNITCPISENIEAVNQLKNLAEPVVSYIQNSNRNDYFLVIVILLIILILFCNSKK